MKLTGRETICEYNGTVDASGNLVDISGAYTTPAGIVKVQHDLTAYGSPTRASTTILTQNGDLWPGRTLNGSSQYFSKAYHANFDRFASDFTLTMVLNRSTSPGADKVAFRMGNFTTSGIAVEVLTSGRSSAKIYRSDAGYVQVLPPANYPFTNTAYHSIQVVRKSNLAKVIEDGAVGVHYNVSGYGAKYGSDGGSPFVIGVINPQYYPGDILYFRLDAEALSDEQLENERQALYGYGMGTQSKVFPVYSRAANSSATSAYKEIGGSLKPVMANMARVGSDGLLLEEQRTNLLLQSSVLSNASWTKLDSAQDTISANSSTILAPNGNAEADGIVGYDNDVVHGVTQAVTLTAANYTISGHFYPGNKGWVYLSDNSIVGGQAYAYFNITTGTVGTVGAGVVSGLYGMKKTASGFWRCWITVLGTAASHTIQFSPAHADTDNTFAGDHATVNTWVWGLQVELGSHPTSQIETTTTTGIRYADDFTLRPWNLNTALTLGTETWSTAFDQDVVGSGTVSLCGKTFTQAGHTYHRRTPDLKHFYEFDGTDDYLTITDTAFRPAGSFSVVAVVTPDATTGDAICGMWKMYGNERCWALQTDTSRYAFYVSSNGSDFSEVTYSAANSLVVGRTQLVTVTFQYSGNSGVDDSPVRIYVDDLTVATDNQKGPVYQSATGPFLIGAIGPSNVNYFDGKIHYLAYHDGTVLLQANHDAMYARMKTDGILPLVMTGTTPVSKFLIDFEAKCHWSNTTNNGNTSRSIVEIGGSWTGATYVTSSAQNRAGVGYTGDGKLFAVVYDNTPTIHYLQSNAADSIDWSKWHRYQFYFDLADMANSYLKVDGSTTGFTDASNMTGACGTLYFRDTKIRYGQSCLGTVTGNVQIRNESIKVG